MSQPCSVLVVLVSGIAKVNALQPIGLYIAENGDVLFVLFIGDVNA